MTTLDIDADDFLAGFDAAMTDLRAGSVATVEETVAAVHDDAVVFAPHATGNLERHIYHEVRAFAASVHGEVGVRGVFYAAEVEYGSVGEVERPETAKVMRFWADGRWIFRRVVRHPATPPQPFMRPAWLRAPGHFHRAVAAHLGRGR